MLYSVLTDNGDILNLILQCQRANESLLEIILFQRSLCSTLSRRLAPEQGTSPVGSAVEPLVFRPLRR